MLNKQTIVSAGPASLLMAKLGEGRMGGKRHWPQAGSLFFLPPKSAGFPILCGGLKLCMGPRCQLGTLSVV